MSILSVTAAQRFDSRGNPTVQVTIETEKGNQSKGPYGINRRRVQGPCAVGCLEGGL